MFLVRDVDGFSTEETAEALGISVPTVKTRLHRARIALREAIGALFEGNGEQNPEGAPRTSREGPGRANKAGLPRRGED